MTQVYFKTLVSCKRFMSIKLKLLRIEAAMTLEELAQAAELTRSYVSKVERGMATPSIGAALKLAKALRVSVEELFGEVSATDAVTVTRAAITKNNNPIKGAPRLVAGSSPGYRMLAFVLEPGKERGRGHLMSHHEGEELLYVLSGTVSLELAKRTELMGVGDCAHFNSAVPHRITCSGPEKAEVLVVIASPTPAPLAKAPAVDAN
jgi:transcriptional regulator with XRE-family HTH domain